MKKTFLIAVLYIFSFNASAKLGMDTFDEMVSRSELIVSAIPFKIESNKTTFTIKNIYKGTIKNKKIIISHSREIHDQRIQLTNVHILFLYKEPKLGWQGSSYGRSYWPLVHTYHTKDIENRSCISAVPYVYPFNMVKLGSILKLSSMAVHYPYFRPKKGEVEQMVICSEEIIKAVKHLTTRPEVDNK